MDKLAKYQEYIKILLTNYASDDVSDNDVEVQLILDTERNHYQWMNVGWQGFNRIYRCVMHFDITDGKIWLQQNLTDRNPAEELVMMGVPREDIVLGLQAPYKRQYTGASQMCKNLDSPHPLTPSPILGEGELELCLPSPKDGRGVGGEGKDLSKIGMLPSIQIMA